MTPICAVGAWIVLGLVFVLVTPAARTCDVPTPPFVLEGADDGRPKSVRTGLG